MNVDDPFFSHKYFNKKSTKLYHKRLTSEMISSTIKKTVKSANLDPSLFSCHSIRIGSATEMRTMGYDTLGISEATGMSSNKTVGKYSRRTSNDIGALSNGRAHKRLCIDDLVDMENHRRIQRPSVSAKSSHKSDS
jgi:hypothetical protein